MWRDYIFVITVLLGGACSTSTELTTDMCSYFKNCTCFSLNEYEVQCPSSILGIVMHFTQHEKIQIDCYHEDKYKLDNLPDVNINVKEFIVRFCQLPTLRFEYILQKFNITDLEHLTIEECELGNNSLSKINAKFFEGIPTLKTLKINSVSINFADDAFINFPNLVQLYMEQNKLTKIGYMFENITKLRVLHLSRNSLESLPAGVFKKLSDLRELHLWQNELTDISANDFIGLNNLKSLELSVNSIKYVDDNAFSELKELVNISLRANKLHHISYNIFKNNYQLENVRIDTNPNLTITDYVFANLINLKTISMYQCNLEVIPEHAFQNCTNLITLDLKNNRLKQLTNNMFNTLKRLQNLNLSNNKLSALPERIFSSLENLQDLKLQGNQLSSINKGTFEGLKNLKYLVLKQNKITHIDAGAFSSQRYLLKLDLSYNELTEDKYKYALSTFEKIETIFLNHNNISTFPEEILSSAVKLKVLDLSYNSLKDLFVTSLVKVSNSDVKVDLTHNHISSVNFFNANYVAKANMQADAYHNSNYTTTRVILYQNPLICDCNNFELIQYLHGKLDALKIIADIKIGDQKCFGPPSFEHITLKDLRPEQISCEYTGSGCPTECKCSERSYDHAVVVDCSFRNLTYWPQLALQSEKIEVNIVHNLLESAPPKNQGYEMVKNLFLSHNRLKTFDWCPSYIEVLKLDHNNLSSLSPNVVLTIEKSTKFSNLTLQGNQWSCSCSAFSLQNFLKTYYNKTQVDGVLCEDNKTRIIDKKDLCKSVSVIVAQIAIPILVIFFITACIIALYFKFKKEIKIWLYSKGWCLWFVTEEELDKDKIYDIFLSFSHKDEDFVAQNLVPSLEKSFKLCIHSRDWIPGELINDQIVDSVYNSRRTVVILSNNFLESAWGKFEFLMAHKQSLEEGRPRVIVIKLGDLNSDKMNDDFKAYIKTNTYVEWGEPWFWKKLLYALPHSSKNLSKTHTKHANMMLKIDDKFELVPEYILQPDSTPPVISDNTTLLKKHPLNFNISSSINKTSEA